MGQTRRITGGGIPEAHKITRGLAIDNLNMEYERKTYSKAGNLSDDSKNRIYVKKQILKYINTGLSEEEALDKIMQDDIVNEFEYLRECNIRECFRNWARAYKKQLAEGRKNNDFTR